MGCLPCVVGIDSDVCCGYCVYTYVLMCTLNFVGCGYRVVRTEWGPAPSQV